MTTLNGCKRVCQYCQETIGYKEGEEGTTTHGICDKCGIAEAYRRETLAHVVEVGSLCNCDLISFHPDHIIARCDEGKRLLDKWKLALKAQEQL